MVISTFARHLTGVNPRWSNCGFDMMRVLSKRLEPRVRPRVWIGASHHGHQYKYEYFRWVRIDSVRNWPGGAVCGDKAV